LSSLDHRRRPDRIRGTRKYGGVLIVSVTCPGPIGLEFLVDTGAAMTAITPATAVALGPSVVRPLRKERIAPVGKALLSAPVVRLQSLQVGGCEVVDLDALILDLPPGLHIDGLLGVNFLERFRMTIEFDTATLILRRKRGG